MKPYNNDRFYNINYEFPLEDKLSTSLLSGYSQFEYDTELRRHCGGDPLCFKYQYEYFEMNLKEKKKYINKICNDKLPKLSIWKRYRIYASNKCFGSSLIKLFYLCSRFYCYMFPIYWFIYVYFHTEKIHNHGYNDDDKNIYQWFIDKHNKYEHLFVVIMMILYIINIIIFVKSIYLFCKIEWYYGYIMGMKIYWKEINHFNGFLQRNKIIMIKINNYKISCIIISYLKNNHSSYNWILSSRI